MPYDGPGLEYRPPDEELVRLRSLMPDADRKPNPFVRLLKLPFKLITVPLKKIFGRTADEEDADV